MSVNIENLDKLINHLKKIKPRNFDMRRFVIFDFNKGWYQKPAKELIERLETKGDCGTN